jgi:hypothetical protein
MSDKTIIYILQPSLTVFPLQRIFILTDCRLKHSSGNIRGLRAGIKHSQQRIPSSIEDKRLEEVTPVVSDLNTAGQ